MNGRLTRFSLMINGVLVVAAGVAAEPGQVLETDRVRVVVEPRSAGMSIVFDGVEVSKSSELVVTTPGWTPHFYVGPTEKAVASARMDTVEGGTRLCITHVGERDAFEGTETITLFGNGRIEQHFIGRFLEADGEALIQWRIGALNPAIVSGRRFTAVLRSGQRIEQRVPISAVSANVDESTLARGFESIEFDSRLGPIRIDVKSSRELIVYDFRKSQWADLSDPFFWFGDLGTRFGQGDPVEYRITYHLPATSGKERDRPIVAVRAATTPAPDAQTARVDGPPMVIPKPKEAAYENQYAEIVDASILRFAGAAKNTDETTELSRRAKKILQEWLARRTPNRAMSEVAQHGAIAALKQPTILFVLIPLGNNLPREGYVLKVSPEIILIQARDERGFINAVQTIKQLVVPGPNGSILVRCCTIRDWPALAFRGVHLFAGGQGPDLHNRLIEDIIGAGKLNHIVLEAEYIEWDSHPEIHHPEYGMPKAEVREILDTCRSLGIEVIPLVQSLGHCQWMFEHDQNLELAEDPKAKWAYCVTNPKTYDFIFDVFTEAIELFHPKYFHIGHDEFADRGRVPYREASRKFTIEQLLMMDAQRLHDWFAQRGIRMMMWGDMLLAKGEAPDACNADSVESARALRGQLPDDIVITDWHYAAAAPDKFTSLGIFRQAGHETIASTWYRPANIVNFARAAHDNGSLGLLQTTWAGYSLDPESYEREIHQYENYVLAAEAAWNADRPPDPETYRAGWHFYDLMGESTLRPQYRSGALLHLDAAFNYALAAGGDTGWFGLGPQHDLSAAPSGETRLRGIRFALGAPGEQSAMVLDGKLAADQNLPVEIQLNTGCAAGALAILHAANFSAARGTKLGEYEATFDDGSKQKIELVYGKNMFAYNDLAAAPVAPVVWTGATPAGEPIALRVLIWKLAEKHKSLRRLALRSADAPASIMVLGITAFDTP